MNYARWPVTPLYRYNIPTPKGGDLSKCKLHFFRDTLKNVSYIFLNKCKLHFLRFRFLDAFLCFTFFL